MPLNHHQDGVLLHRRQYKCVIALCTVHMTAILFLSAVLIYFFVEMGTSVPGLISEARTGIGALRHDVADMTKYLQDLDRKFPNTTDAC